MSAIPNTTQLPHIIIRKWLPQLSDTGLRVLLIIVDQTLGWEEDPITHTRKKEDWVAYSQLKIKTGRANTAISNALRELEQKKFILITNGSGKVLKTKDERIGKRLFYRLNTTSPESGEVSFTHNLSGKRNPESGDTKETNTKTLSKDKGRVNTSCPLLNGSTLKEKYPNGHSECVEYLISEEEDRTTKFINREKQFMFIHKILRAGYGFDAMDKTIRLVEKKYGPGTWDYGTLASWLEKGSNA